jgi:cephalosporin-C deacetylase-like acetyl esterase
MLLVGEFLGAWFAWDAIRALDYLLTRPEIDEQHIGVTGNSGGGTQTTWLCGLEPRFTMGAPSCFVTTFRRDAENELPQDSEQCPPRVLAFDLDHCDFLAAMAPKPVIIMAQEKDYFDARGSAETSTPCSASRTTSRCTPALIRTATRNRTARRCIASLAKRPA